MSESSQRHHECKCPIQCLVSSWRSLRLAHGLGVRSRLCRRQPHRGQSAELPHLAVVIDLSLQIFPLSPRHVLRVSDVQSPCSNPASLPSGELKIVLVPAPRTGQVAVLSEAALQLSPRQRGSSSRPRRLPNAGSGKGRAERALNTHIVPCPWSTERRVSTPPKGVVADAVSSLSRPAITWVGY